MTSSILQTSEGLLTRIFEIEAVPDLYRTEHRRVADGDLFDVVCRGGQELARMVADTRDSYLCLKLLYTYLPADEDSDPQSRLRIYLVVITDNPVLLGNMAVLISHGRLSQFYKFKHEEECFVPWETFKAVCQIVRPVRLLQPSIFPAFNPAIPRQYLVLELFQARERPEFSALDSILNKINEPVVLEVIVWPTDTTKESVACANYLERLRRLEHPPFHDDDDEFESPVFVGHGSSRQTSSRHPIRPPRPMRDELVPNVARSVRELAESLTKRNLEFRIQVFSASIESARLIAGVFAENCIDGGAYMIYSEHFSFSSNAEHVSFEPTPVFSTLFQERIPEYFMPMERIPHLATVEELSAALTLPIGGPANLCCTRKDTDPPYSGPNISVIVGYDVDDYKE